jgi:superfamily II DNA helicase RecQ
MASLKGRGIKGAILKTVTQGNMMVGNHEDGSESEEDSDVDDERMDFERLNIIAGENIRNENAKLVFAHPEAFISCREGRKILLSEVFQKHVVTCVIDEGHLVDEWGFEFRPDFGKLCQLASIFPSAPFLVLTATAPKHVRETLINSLLLTKPLHQER